MKWFAAISIAWLLAPVSAQACSCSMSHAWSRPISTQANCSFKDGGRGFYGHAIGREAIDIGGGRVRQTLRAGKYCCVADEILVFADCTTGQAVAIGGIEANLYSDGEVSDIYIAGTYTSYVRLLLAPEGPISLTAQSTARELGEVAQTHDLRVTEDVRSLWRRGGENYGVVKRFDPLCGCKLFYPDSEGAR